jgi:Mg/Co/Ni transporter MgtE
MSVENSMSLQFLTRHPVDAARVLEQLSPLDVAALFEETPTNVAATALAAMLANSSAACLSVMDPETAAALLDSMPVTNAARIFSLLSQEKQKVLSKELSAKTRKRILRFLSYRALSAGDLMNPNVDMLMENLTVADAIRRIERHRQSVKCEIYIVDKLHRFLGFVDLGNLMTSRQQVRLRDIMGRSLPTVSVHASSESLLNNSSWAGRRRLPVVESDNTLVGILDYERVKEAVDKDYNQNRDPMENLFSLAGLYWLTLVQLLDSMLNIAVVKKGDNS